MLLGFAPVEYAAAIFFVSGFFVFVPVLEVEEIFLLNFFVGAVACVESLFFAFPSFSSCALSLAACFTAFKGSIGT